jgi:hypothetical protein
VSVNVGRLAVLMQFRTELFSLRNLASYLANFAARFSFNAKVAKYSQRTAKEGASNIDPAMPL